MSKKIIILLLIFISSFVNAQKRDNIWPLSYLYGPGYPMYYLDFSGGLPDTITYNRKMNFFICGAAMSDTSGNIMYYTNGSWIANNMHDTLAGSSDFNPGTRTTNNFNGGLPNCQCAIFLPFSDSSSLCYVVSVSGEYFYNKDGYFDGQPVNLTYSIIDKSLDSNRGGIPVGQKNIIAINDTLINGRLTACKHANGRDWWLVTHKYYSDMYYVLLFTPQGVFGPYSQQIGSVFPAVIQPNGFFDFDINGSGRFSPDGTKYISIGYGSTMDVLDFDRCSGTFSNCRTIQLPVGSNQQDKFHGGEFSPNSKYFYANTLINTYQYNMDSSNINLSQISIAQYDTFLNPTDCYFFMSQLGPDGKIYLSTWGANNSLHVIEYPDSNGISSTFNQHGYTLPQWTGGNHSVPNFPNYRLGRLVGSPCDTLTSLPETDVIDFKLKLNPNPNNGNFIINYQLPQNKSGTLQIMDVLGKQVYTQPLPQWSTMQRMNLPNIPAGVYIIKLTFGTNSSFEKFIKE